MGKVATRFSTVLLTIIMALGICTASSVLFGAANPAYAATTDTVLAFTSDTHNTSGNAAANRLGTWLDKVADIYGKKVDVMSFGGDMAGAGASGYWTLAQADMDKLTDRGITGVYTTGNHEISMGGDFSYSTYKSGGYSSTETKGQFEIDKQEAEGSNYRIYCLGSHTSSSSYTDSISALTSYLNSVGNDKPIFIITHFPLHYYSSRSTSGASDVIGLLNSAVADGKKIVFLWGHNHTMSDTYYDYIYRPGDKIPTSSSSSSQKEIQFYYGAAGCMSDSDYGTGSGYVKGKGLVVTINSDKKLTFTYYNANGTDVSEGGTFTEKDPVPIQGATIDEATSSGGEQVTPSVAAGKSLQLHYTPVPADATVKSVTWSSSDTSIATVSDTGKVKGVSPGKVTITATISDGITRGQTSTSVELEITEATGSTVTVEIAPTSSNSPTESATINVGDTLVINVKNGSSNAYDYTATLSKTGVAEFQDDSSVHIEGNDTGQITVEGVANGTVDITIQNNGSYSNRKGTIHLTVGDGTTPIEPQSDGKIDITPSTSNPEESIQIAVDDTLTINVTNGSSSTAYDFTATLSGSGVAEFQGNSTVNIAAGATGTFTVKGLKDGTVDITIQNNQSSSSHTRKGVIHLTVGEGDAPVEPADETVSITPTTDNPEASASIKVGETLDIVVTNGSSNSGYDYTATLSSSGVAEFQGASTVTIAQGSTGTFTVKGLAEGTVDINIQNNQSSSSYTRKGVVHLTVGEGGTPVDPGEDVTYVLADTLEDGGEYVIANGNTGSVYVVGDTSTGSGTSTGLVGISASVSGGSITLSSANAAKAAFTAELKTSDSGSVSAWLKHNGSYLYTASSGGLRISSEQTSSGNTGKFWHYKADGKNLLWFFKDTSSSDGYTDTSSTYKYYLNVSSGNFIAAHVDSTSLANTSTPAIYIYAKSGSADPVTVTGVTLSPTTASVKAGKTTSLTATVAPSNATNKAVTWSSSDPTVATVSNGTVTGVKEGTVTITVKTEDGDYTATATVTVTANTDTRYDLVDSLEDGGEYLIVSANSGSAYALKNPGGTSGGTAIANSANKTAVTIESGDYILASDDDIVWTATAVEGGFNLTNGSDYLEGASGNVSVFNPQKYDDRYWTYNSSSQLQHKGGQSTYTLRYSSSSNYFQGSTSSSSSYTVYLFKKASSGPVAVTGVTLSPTTASVKVGKTTALTATVLPKSATNKNVTWTTSDDTVATVSNGTVTGVKAGTATITVKTEDGNYTATCAVTVKEASATTDYVIVVDGYALSTDRSPNTAQGGSSSYTYTGLAGVEYTSGDAAASNIRWTFEETDGGYYIMDQDGNYLNGTYTSGSNSGSGDLKVDGTKDVWVLDSGYSLDDGTVDGSKLKSTNASNSSTSDKFLGYENSENLFTVRSSSNADPVTIEEASGSSTVINVTGVSLNKTSTSLTAGDTETLTATVAPSNATNKSVTWSSSAPSVATVDSNGKVTAVAAGSATITVTTVDGSKTATCAVTVTAATVPVSGVTLNNTSLSLTAGETGTLTATITPSDATNKDVTWSSSDTSVATVDSTGKVTAVAAGTATITVTTVDGSKTATCTVTVKPVEITYTFNNFTWTGNDSAGYTAVANYTGSDESTKTVDATVTSKITAEATCEVAGQKVFTATVSAANSLDKKAHTEDKNVAIPATGHNYGTPTYTWAADNSSVTATRTCANDSSHVDTQTVTTTSAVTKPATCEAKGETTYTATFTNTAFATQTKTVENIDALGHDYGAWTVTKDATCTAKGEETRTCSRCGDKQTREIAMVDHAWGDGVMTTLPTCEGEGVVTFTCTACGEIMTMTQPALGHDWNDPVYTWEMGENGEYTGYTATHTCKRDATHVESETATVTKTVVAEATETEDGLVVYSSSEFVNSAFKAKDKEVVIPATGHDLDYDNVEFTWTGDDFEGYTAATATVKCKSGDGYEVTVEAIVVPQTTGATCTAAGQTVYTASATFAGGNFTDTRTVEIPALGHKPGNPTVENVVAATCTEAGSYELNTYCTACGEKLAGETVAVEALGHSASEPVMENVVAAGCTEAGSYELNTYCTACGEKLSGETVAVEALGHDFGAWRPVIPATCTEAGSEARYCSRCSASETREVAALGHKWDAGKVTKEATSTTAGVKTFTCETCGETRTEAIPAVDPGSDPKKMGEDGTAVGPGASAAAAEAAILGMTSDGDPKGTNYLPLELKSKKQAKNSITISWAKQSKAAKYVVYGNLCGKKYKMAKIATVSGSKASKVIKKIAGKKLKAGKAYKLIVVALDKDNLVVSTSKLIHVNTKGGKNTNHKTLTIKQGSKVVKSLAIAKGSKATIKATGVKADSKLGYSAHVAVRYCSSSAKVCKVNKKGVITAKKAGTCYVYAYSQNGVNKKIKVTVK